MEEIGSEIVGPEEKQAQTGAQEAQVDYHRKAEQTRAQSPGPSANNQTAVAAQRGRQRGVPGGGKASNDIVYQILYAEIGLVRLGGPTKSRRIRPLCLGKPGWHS